MANEESFILLSLKEKKSKKLAQVISSDTCRKILEYMASKDFVTETGVAKDLALPLSTVHYNIKSLHESRMLTADEFHYSEKGKEVPHYKLANKFIIIAPNNEKSVFNRLKRFMPVGVVLLSVAFFFTFVRSLLIRTGSGFLSASTNSMYSADMVSQKILEKSAPVMADSASLTSVDIASQNSFSCLSQTSSGVFPWLTASLAFVSGIIFCILIYFIWKKFFSKKRQK